MSYWRGQAIGFLVLLSGAFMVTGWDGQIWNQVTFDVLGGWLQGVGFSIMVATAIRTRSATESATPPGDDSRGDRDSCVEGGGDDRIRTGE